MRLRPISCTNPCLTLIINFRLSLLLVVTHLVPQIYLAIVALAQEVRCENRMVTYTFDLSGVNCDHVSKCLLRT